MSTLPEVMGAVVFLIAEMEQLEAGNSHSTGIAELSEEEVRYALWMAIGMMWQENLVLARLCGQTFEQSMQAFRSVVAAI